MPQLSPLIWMIFSFFIVGFFVFVVAIEIGSRFIKVRNFGGKLDFSVNIVW